VTSLADLNALPAHAAEPLFAACCGAPGWVQAMLGRRPFETLDEMLSASDEACAKLSPEQWLAAFAHHPRIGEHRAAAPVGEAAQQWSAGEQSAAMGSAESVQDELLEAQRLYELRFGYIFIICASGRSAGEILEALRARMDNSPDEELRAAAEEQQKITRLRLQKLVGTQGEERP
jgi:OHCU decarboxylase